MIKPLFQKAVVAVNGSEQSLHAAMYGIMMASQYKIELEAVYVVDSETIRQLEVSKIFFAEEAKHYTAALRKDGEKYLNYVSDLALQKKVKISTKLCEGAVWSEVLKAADDFKADLILLGGKEHGNESIRNVVNHDKASAINTEIIGSASCNVLVVRKPEIDKLFKLA